jgi:hypothetical protein
MPATIYNFPERRTYYRGYKIPLYTEEEIFLTIFALNMFGGIKENVTENTLENYNPIDVIKALLEAKSCFALSTKARHTIMNILKSIETL